MYPVTSIRQGSGPRSLLCNDLASTTVFVLLSASRQRSIEFRSIASRAKRAALTSLTSGNGLPNCRALFWMASLGRFSTTEARKADVPLSRSARRSSICSGVQLRLVTRVIARPFRVRRLVACAVISGLQSAAAQIKTLSRCTFSVCPLADTKCS